MAGRREYLGLVRYWGDIPDILGKETLGLDVHVTQTYFIAHSFKRAADLARQVRLILEQMARPSAFDRSQPRGLRGGCSPAVLIWLTVLPASRRSGRHTWAPRFGMSIRFGRNDSGAEYMQAGAFNPRIPMIPEIPQISYAGRACMALDFGCVGQGALGVA